jgi:hypothetical protein
MEDIFSFRIQEPFETSSDEEKPSSLWNDIFHLPVKIQHANETSGQKLPKSCTKKIGEVNYLKLTSFDGTSVDSSFSNPVKDDNDVANGNIASERKDSIVTDAKFDCILASLQSLAVEIERDFQTESGAKFPKLSPNRKAE